MKLYWLRHVISIWVIFSFFVVTPLYADVVCPVPTCPSCPACPSDVKAKSDDWKASAAVGFSLTRGNSDTTLITGDLRADRERGNDIWRFQLTGASGESDSETTQEYIKGETQYNYLFTERFYGGLGVTGLKDNVADIDYRAIVNPLLGYFLVKEAEVKFSGEAGPSYTFERQGDEDDNYLSPRVAERFEWILSPTAKLFQSAEVIFDASDSENYLVNAEAGVEAALTTMLSLVLTVKNAYDHQPAADRDENDLSIISSLKVALY